MSNSRYPSIDPNDACTRRHAIKVFAACAGGAVFGGPLMQALGGLPWSEQPPGSLLAAASSPLSLASAFAYDRSPRHAYPSLAFSGHKEQLWTSWTQLHDEHEAIFARPFTIGMGQWGPAVLLSESTTGNALDSDMAFVDSRMITVWSEHSAGGWTLVARALDPATGEPGACRTLAGGGGAGEIHWHPAIAVIRDRVIVVWQAKCAAAERFEVLGQVVTPDAEPSGKPFTIASVEASDCCHPAVVTLSGETDLAVAFERHGPSGTRDICLTTVQSATRQVAKPRVITTHPASDLAPALAVSPDGEWLWLAWHSDRRGEDAWDVTPWYRIAALRLRDDTWHVPVGADDPAPGSERGTVQGFELMRLAVSPDGVVCALGRASHNFYVQYYTSEGRSPLYRLPDDGWGGRGRLLRGLFDDDGALWVTRRDLGINTLHRIDGFAGLAGPPPLKPMDEPSRTDARPLRGVGVRHEWPDSAVSTGDLQLYFGDIHGHSWQSDGMGDPESLYARARDVVRDDFHVLTDHDYFVGKRLNDAQWQQQKEIVEHYHAPGSFVTLLGQEWTTARTNRPHGWGHFNVYSADPTIPLFDHTDPRWRDLPDLYAAMRGHNAIAIPHHIGWTGVRWDTVQPDLTPVVEICSVHGAFEVEGNEPIRHRGGLKGCFYRDALAAGLRVGVVGGSDQHGLTWHHGVCWKRNCFRAGFTGVWAPELTREAILDAFRNRRTFATTGVKLCLRFSVNDELMGGTISAGEPPRIRVDVAVPPSEERLAWLEVVRDQTVIHRYGGEGQRSRYTFVDEKCPLLVADAEPPATCTYYLRVTLANGNMAWSSPVWVERA